MVNIEVPIDSSKQKEDSSLKHLSCVGCKIKPLLYTTVVKRVTNLCLLKSKKNRVDFKNFLCY